MRFFRLSDSVRLEDARLIPKSAPLWAGIALRGKSWMTEVRSLKPSCHSTAVATKERMREAQSRNEEMTPKQVGINSQRCANRGLAGEPCSLLSLLHMLIVGRLRLLNVMQVFDRPRIYRSERNLQGTPELRDRVLHRYR